MNRPAPERVVLVGVGLKSEAGLMESSLEELRGLAATAGAVVAAETSQALARYHPGTLIGSGKVLEVTDLARRERAATIVFDMELSPAQQKNLERECKAKIIDRTRLILDIFAQRARSFEGKLEVELAQLKHLATRLVRGWTHLERQKGGIGLRGPGETQLETDRRLLGERVRVLTRRLERIKRQRETGRRMRKEIPVPSVALVGYTNAGKSTLFRALTGADAYVADQLFATLDPTVRRIRLPGGTPIVIADTVGFIRELPHELVAAFQATLTEAREASLLLHVIDASDPRRETHRAQVDEVLAEIGAQHIPQVLVYNKIDRLGTAPRLERDEEGRPAALWCSAARADGLDLLQQAIAERLSRAARAARLRISPAAGGALRSRLYARGAVRDERTLEDGTLDLAVELPQAELEVLARARGVEIVTPCGPADGAASGDAPCAAQDAYLQSIV